MVTTTIPLLPDVVTFLARQPLGAVIGPSTRPPDSGSTFLTVDPGTGQPLAEVYASQPPDVVKAVD